MIQWYSGGTMRLRKWISLWILIGVVSCAHPKLAPPPQRQVSQHLFIAVDGIPFDLARSVYEEYFEYSEQYAKPVRVISTFPSTSTIAFTGLFRGIGAGRSAGYDSKFYSYEQNKVLGSLMEADDFAVPSFSPYFVVKRSSGFDQMIMYAFPSMAMDDDLEKIKPELWKSPNKENIFVYLGSTDGVAHLDGREELEEMFVEVLDYVENLREEYEDTFEKPLKVTLFSDHGVRWVSLNQITVGQVEDQIDAAGFQLRHDQLKNDNDVVSVTWGNVSGAHFYCSEENAADVSKALSNVEGFELIFYRKKNQIFVLGDEGHSLAEIKFDILLNRYGYHPIIGDPLHYKVLVKALREEKNLDAQGTASEKDWFRVSKNHAFPDALYRVVDSFTGLVKNPAAIIVSIKENYEYGDTVTRVGAFFRGGMLGTHGSIRNSSSSAFLMTSDKESHLPETLRYDQALKSVFK